MCGIAGALDLVGHRTFPIDRAVAMTRAISHRGPDAEGIHREPGVFLGARRLSIVDLTGGFQPMANEDGSIWVAFNGELYEDDRLRRDLIAQGHRLATRCDTEVWVHLFEDYGEGVFRAARGQFAVSLWDRNHRTLHLARDRAGICPLFYAERDGWLLWASEIKALLASGLVAPEPDPRGIDYFFHTFSASIRRTCFRDVHLLPPGHFVRAEAETGRLHEVTYWDLDFPDAGDERREENPEGLIEEFEALLRGAVRRRLRGDVPVVSYISGGLDSAIVLGLAGQERRSPLPSFSVALDRAGPDERSKAAEAAEGLGSPLTLVEMSKPRIAEAFPELIRAAEMPVMDTACATLLRLAQSVHSAGYKVALTGEGADEAMAGYPWHRLHAIRDRFKARFGETLPRLGREWFLDRISRDPRGRNPRFPVRGARVAQQELYDMLGQSRCRVYSEGMWALLDGYDAYGADMGIAHSRFNRWDPLNQSLYLGYKVMLPGLLLAGKGDRVAMNASVETRYPLLDEEVVSFCASIAPEYKLRGGVDKWLLREVARRVLPAPIGERVAARPKEMFRASLSRTFLGPHRPAWVDQVLSPESLRRTGFFDPEAVAREVARRRWFPRITPRQGGMDLSLTMVVATQLWHHSYCGGGLCELPTWEAPSLSRSDLSIPDAAAFFPHASAATV
ncbi:asparagine synthase (glutamine-hydrolyzing) [Tautonia sociabilis]|uniref:asparagine synthase (glutamine-hydrolyzing) n=1 Tax=Tautonia sociabilis TaxID=2080755 RepID=A0A432MMU3_9BACT|nr:asparagine synthase (glutamine-hydrolyzing) [Tautonia sociabilis]RUL88742.1 asparagine synthase (glutamine-hydrolyzing) [Tautonia sociabilis]